MAETECTQGQWLVIMKTTLEQQEALSKEHIHPYSFGENHPMLCVDHAESAAFCDQLTALLSLPGGWQCVLPSEAQWEYACRAGTTTAYSFGNKLDPLQANISEADYDAVRKVGQYAPNAWGLLDMHGNALEWCADRYRERLKGGVDPAGASTGVPRVMKGGAFRTGADGVRSGSRYSGEPDSRKEHVGFRPALVLPPEFPASSLAELMPKKPTSKSGEISRLELITQAKAGATVEARLTSDVVMKFCFCPAGTFTMGSERSREPNEAPVEVQITRGYWMARTECTQAQWEAVMQRTLRDQARLAEITRVQGEDEDQPMYLVNHGEALSYCRRLGEMVELPEGWEFALPTEAEWEYACRAGTRSSYHYGEELTALNANCNGMVRIGPKGSNRYQGALDRTCLVGRYAPNAWGLLDMHGNVSEWCSDWMASFDSNMDPVARKLNARLPGGADPQGAKMGARRIVRGGSYAGRPYECTSFYRGSESPGSRRSNVGFRVVVREAGLKKL